MKKISLLLFFFCFAICNAQNYALDSLLSILKGAKEDTNKVKTLLLISKTYYSNANYDTCFLYSNKALKLSEAVRYQIGTAKSLNVLGNIALSTGNYSEASINYSLALKSYKGLGNKKAMSNIYNNIGIMLNRIGNYPAALDNYLLSLKLGEEIKDNVITSSAYNNIGTVYASLKKFPTALKYFSLALKTYQSLDDRQNMGTMYNNIGTLQNDLGNYEQALSNFSLALTVRKEINDLYGQAVIYYGLGNTYNLQGNDVLAMSNFISAAKIFEEMGAKSELSKTFIGMGNLYVLQKNAVKANNFVSKALSIAKEIGNKENIKESYLLFTDLDSLQGNYKQAFAHHKQYVLYKDSLLNEENIEKIVQAQMQYEFDKKEGIAKVEQDKKDALAAEEKKRSLYISIGLGVLFLFTVLFSWLFIRQNKLKTKQQAMKLEQKLLRVQMNPHFIFNSLHAIQKFVLKSDPLQAASYLSSFASLTRSVLENSQLDSVPLSQEVSLLENYLQLQKLRFGTRFEYSISVSQDIDTAAVNIPPMLAQPFIENAIEHGMKDINKGGIIVINFTKQNNLLVFEIKDNGIGIHDTSSNSEHHSMATQITKERIELINKKKTNKTVFEVTEAYPLSDRKGLKVSFSITC